VPRGSSAMFATHTKSAFRLQDITAAVTLCSWSCLRLPILVAVVNHDDCLPFLRLIWPVAAKSRFQLRPAEEDIIALAHAASRSLADR
jgi:hypothetical protein